MYEALLSKRLQQAYRASRWKEWIDERVSSMLGRGYKRSVASRYLPDWLDFLGPYEEGGALLPANIDDARVVAYIDKRRGRRKDLISRRRRRATTVRAALRHLLGLRDRRVPSVRRRSEPALAPFDAHVPGYLRFAEHHLGRRTTHDDRRDLRRFCAWLTTQDVEIGSLSPTHVRDYLASLKVKPRTCARRASVLRVFLRYLGMMGVVSPTLSLRIEVPRIYRMATPPTILDDESVERLLRSVDRSTAIGKRNFAILLIAARYGLRSSDLRRLRLDDVRWRQHRIAIIQSKTQQPLDLPLLDEVETALVDYLRHGRPVCAAREIFVQHQAPIRPYPDAYGIRKIMHDALDAAGISASKGSRGVGLLRHTAATRMLRRGAPLKSISDVLGHASGDTTRIYAQVDIDGLRSVALSPADVRE